MPTISPETALSRDMPTVSVVIPAHDAGPYLSEAVRSVVDQILPPDEVIVVDDGSTDGSVALAKAYGSVVRVLCQPHRGAATARNLGLEHAAGELLAFLDADDLWMPMKLHRQVGLLRERPDLDAALGHQEQFLTPGADPSLVDRLHVDPTPRPGYHVGTMLVRRAALREVGPFDETLRSGEFIDWWARATEKGLRFAMLPEVVMRRRVHGGNHTLRHAQHQREYLRVARMAVLRRRGEG